MMRNDFGQGGPTRTATIPWGPFGGKRRACLNRGLREADGEDEDDEE